VVHLGLLDTVVMQGNRRAIPRHRGLSPPRSPLERPQSSDGVSELHRQRNNMSLLLVDKNLSPIDT